MVATCPPRRCGIATFSSDLATALRQAEPGVRVRWAAIDEVGAERAYSPDVSWRIRQEQPATYARVAEQLNASDADVVHVQHEFGLYGVWQAAVFEDHLRPLLDGLRKPLVTTLHTVPPRPTPSMRVAIERLADRSASVIVMADAAAELLASAYGVEPARLRVVPHGAPPRGSRARHTIKRQLGLDARRIISSFGLLDPRKGLEYMIAAMERVVERHPDALYLILGTTHPELARRAGVGYRDELRAQVAARKLDRHVHFVDEYLSQSQLVEYLLATDVYVTPYLDPDQVTSGTLAYALGAGRAIVSTPYVHAVEALAEERGLLVDFRSAAQLAERVNSILSDASVKRQLERAAGAYGRGTAWRTVGRQTLALLREAAG